jgi:hypothetical protein
MLQRSAEDSRPATFKALRRSPWRTAPAWTAPLAQTTAALGEEAVDDGEAVGGETLEAGAVVLPVAFTLAADGGVGWVACCTAPPSSPFAKQVNFGLNSHLCLPNR